VDRGVRKTKLCSFVGGGGNGGFNSGLVLAGEAHHLNHAPSPICFSYFKSLIYGQVSLDLDPPIYASGVGEMTGVYHHTKLLVQMGS
jgi:hypothetical protein